MREELKRRDLQDFLQPYVAKGVLNKDTPTGEADYADFLALAEVNPELCKRTLDMRVTLLPPQGRTTAPSKRQMVILEAAQDYRGDPQMQKTCSCEAAINLALREAGMQTLSEQEAREYVIL